VNRFLNILFLFVLLNLSVQETSAQGTRLDWVKWMETTGVINMHNMVTDNVGNVYIAGNFSDTCDFDPGPGVYQMIEQHSSNGLPFDIFVVKISPDGNLIWGFKIGGDETDESLGLYVNDSGKLFLCGSYRDHMDADPGPDTMDIVAPPGNNGSNAFLCMFDTSGLFNWVINIGSSSSEAFMGVNEDNQGNVYASLSFNGTVDVDPGAGIQQLTAGGSRDAAVCKYDSAGNYIWAKRIGGTTSTYIYYFMLDDSANVYCQGRFGSTVDFNPGPTAFYLTALGSWDGFTLKLDSAGLFQWAFRIGNSSNIDAIHLIHRDPMGNFVFCGEFTGTVDVDPGPNIYNLTTAASRNPFLVVIDGNANFIKAMQLEGGEAEIGPLTFDTAGYLYLNGYFEGYTDFDPGPEYFYGQSNAVRDFYISKYDPGYRHLWTKTFGGSDDDIQQAFAIGAGNSLYGCGTVSDTVDFEPGSGAHIAVSEDFDCYLAKWDPCISDSSVLADTVCYSYLSPKGFQYTVSGTYRELFLNSSHCDSIVVMNLVINQRSYVDIYDTVCSSYISPSGNYTWDSTGTYNDTIPRVITGCDSVMTFHLVFGDHDTASFQTVTACQRYLSPGGNAWWTTTGIYHDTISAMNGCDSVMTVALTVNTVDTTVSMQPPLLIANADSASYQWMYCDSSIITGEVNQSLLADSNAWYAVLVTQNGCTDTSACYSLSTVSAVGIPAPIQFTISPNPTGGLFVVDAMETDMYAISIYNTMGQRLVKKEQCSSRTSIDFSRMEPGCYMVVISSDRSVLRKMLLKN
jgi:hypothetical protein